MAATALIKDQLEKDLSKIIKDKIGKGPKNLEVSIFNNIVVCHMDEFMTKAEQLIVEAGHPEKVSEYRNIYINQCFSEMNAVFDKLLNKTAKEFFSSYVPKKNAACWTIFLG